MELIPKTPLGEAPFEIFSERLIVRAWGIPISEMTVKMPVILITIKIRLNSKGGNNLDKIRFVIKRQPLVTMLPFNE